MKQNKIKKKYGIKTYNKLCEVLEGTVVHFDEDGDIDIPDKDIKRGFKILKKSNNKV